jgi:pimeloyl-ACP methyl ester carboxylesterase
LAIFLVAHGAWSAGWAWKKMHPLLRKSGHRLLTPSYTGLGERAHLANPNIDLETHIQDILGVIEFEELRAFTLIGHSYGGMVATGIADRVPERIGELIYLDAFVTQDGQTLADLVPPERRRRMTEQAQKEGYVLPNPIPPDTDPADIDWITTRRLPHPFKCFDTPLRLRDGGLSLPRSYVYCARCAPDDNFGQFAKRAKKEPGWRYFELDASHSPHITAPDALAALLDRIVSSRS